MATTAPPWLHRIAATLRHGMAAPVRLATYRNLLYLGLLFPLGLGYFVGLTVGLSVGGSLLVLGVGVILLAVTLGLARGLAWFERLQLRYLLATDVEQPPCGRGRDGVVETAKGFFLDWMLLRELVFLASKFAWGLGSFVLLVWTAATTMSFLVVPLYYDAPGARVGVVPEGSMTFVGDVTVPFGEAAVSAYTVIEITGWSIDTLPEALVFAGIGLLVLVAMLNVFNGLAGLAAWYGEVLLDPDGLGRAADTLRGMARRVGGDDGDGSGTHDDAGGASTHGDAGDSDETGG